MVQMEIIFPNLQLKTFLKKFMLSCTNLIQKNFLSLDKPLILNICPGSGLLLFRNILEYLKLFIVFKRFYTFTTSTVLYLILPYTTDNSNKELSFYSQL